MRAALHARQRYRKYGSATFPTLVNPFTLAVGDSITAHERFSLNINAATLTRDGTTNPGRITAPVTNSGGNAFWGTPRVAIVNTTDTSFEIVGRNNFQDSGAGTAGFSIHTQASDTYASRIPVGNPTSAATTTQAISNGAVINLERSAHIGVTPHTNMLFGGGIDVYANLGHPGVLATGSGSTAMVAYAKQMCQAAGGTALVFIRLGTNDVKSNVTPNTIWASYKTLLDSLTGLDGLGGNAVCVVRSVPTLGSATANIGGLTYAQVNETVIGKCSTSNTGALSVDSTLYTIQSVAQHTINYQIWAYCVANPTKLLFVDETSPSYDFTNHSTYDTTFPDSLGNGHTGDGTHPRTNSCRLQAAREYAAISPYVSYPLVIPRSSGDSTTPGGRTRLSNRGPWSTAVVTTGFLTGGTGSNGVSTALPKGGNAGIPSGWVCGRNAGNTSTKWSVYDAGDGATNGYWVNGEITANSANDSAAIYPYGSSGVNISTFSPTITATDQSEIQFVFEVRWDGGVAAGLGGIRCSMTTNGSGLYGNTTNGEGNDDTVGMPDVSPTTGNTGNLVMATGWIQMSNSSITSVTPLIQIYMTSITGVTCNVGVRCVGINKR